MIEVTLPPGNENINRRMVKSWQMHSPTLEVTKWLEDKGLPCIYKQLWGAHPSGDLRRSQTFYGVRFSFDDERIAVMFKLTFGGV